MPKFEANIGSGAGNGVVRIVLGEFSNITDAHIEANRRIEAMESDEPGKKVKFNSLELLTMGTNDKHDVVAKSSLHYERLSENKWRIKQ